MVRTRLGILVVSTLLGGCQPAAPPARPAPASPAASAGLRPLTAHHGSLPPGHPPTDPASAPAASPSDQATAIAGTVVLAAGLRPPAGGVLYVIARHAGSGQIVATRRETGVTIPFAFRISAADAMVTGTGYAGPFDLTARLSTTGDAMPGPGDVEGTTRGVEPGARGVTIRLDRTWPPR